MTSADDFVLQLLLDHGIVDAATLDAAREQATEGQSDGDPDAAVLEVLFSQRTLSQMQVAEILAQEFSMEVVDLNEVRASPESLEVIGFDLANRYKVFPLEVDDAEVELAICDPLDMDAIDSISHVVTRSLTYCSA